MYPPTQGPAPPNAVVVPSVVGYEYSAPSQVGPGYVPAHGPYSVQDYVPAGKEAV